MEGIIIGMAMAVISIMMKITTSSSMSVMPSCRARLRCFLESSSADPMRVVIVNIVEMDRLAVDGVPFAARTIRAASSS